jgi:RsiW-degrading membrane proteinase PrsW (M82 family)
MTASVTALESPLRRPKVARRTALALSALLLLAAWEICAAVGGLGSAATAVFVRALVISSVLSLIPIAILWYLDRRERESPALFAAAFLWGGLIATTLALPANTIIVQAVAAWLKHDIALAELLGPNAALMIGAPLAAPIVEETTKGIGIVLLFWLMRGEFDNTRDGFIYGALVGCGFNWFESAMYVQQNFVQFGTAPFGFQLGVRYAWLGLGGHAMFSGIFGAALGYARVTSRRWFGALVAAVGLLVAMLAHAWHNALPLVLAIGASKAGEAPPKTIEAPPLLGLLEAMTLASITNAVIFLPFLLLAVWILWRSGKRERDVIREELAAEVGSTVSREEYQAILADRRFRTRRIDSRNRRVSRALVDAQNKLAFRKRRLRLRGFDPEADPVVIARRDQIAELRSHLRE